MSSDNVAKANALKEKGNAAFAKGDNQSAIDLFGQAIALDADNHVLYSNRSAAYTAHGTKHNKQDYLDLAIQDADKAIALKPEFVKAYARKAAALIAKKEYSDAVKAYAAGIAFEPSNSLLTDGLAQAQKLLQKAQSLNNDEVIIGIDLGTTYSAVGVWVDNQVKMIPNDRGNITTPSFVTFTETGKRHIGTAAKNLASQYPRSTLYDVKRLIGKTYEEAGVQDDAEHFSFKVVPSEGQAGKTGRGKPLVEVDMGMHGVKRFAPEEVSAMVLSYLKKCAETFLKREVTKAVVTVPAYFSDSQRVATKAAGRIAGLDVVRIINEPTAAALSYGLDRKGKDKPTNVLIFDLGGGTFDVSVLNINGGIVEVKATGGDTRLGGEDFDIATTQFLIQEGIAKGMPDITGDWKALRRLQTAAEQAKRILSNAEETEIHIEGLYTLEEKVRGTNEKKRVDFKYTLTKAKFEEINKRFFVKCLDTVERVLKDAKMKTNEIHDIVLVGGSTRIPKLQQMLSQHFGGIQLCKSLNPDEAVAYGAAVQGAILTGARSTATDNMLLRDVTPLSLGIETVGRVMSVIIPRNSAIPCVKTQIYTTEENYQTEVDICVYEGERLRTDENNLLGKFTISGIERAKKGEPKVEVSFSLDSNGMLNVTARDLKTMAEAAITIDSSSRSSDDDIDRMLKEAEKYKKDDEERIKQMDALNELETLIADVQSLALEVSDAKKAEQLNNAASDAQSWMEEHAEGAKSAEIKMKKKHLDMLVNKLSK